MTGINILTIFPLSQRKTAGKTQCALLKGTLLRDPTIRLDGEMIHRKNVNKYLGIYLDESLNFRAHIETACGRASALMQKIMSIARRQYGIPLSVIGIYMGAVMASIAGYGASLWAHRLLLVKPRAAVRRAQRGVLVRVSGAFSTVSFEALAVMMNMVPLDLEIRRRAAGYWLRRGRRDRVQAILGEHAQTKGEIWDVVMRIWQEEWQNTEKGSRLRTFFPTITRRRNADYMVVTRGLVHFLTGHGPYPENLNRFGRRVTPLCDCGELGSPEHVVYACVLASPEVRELRVRLGEEDTAVILRDAEKLEILGKLANTVSNEELEKYRRR